MAQTAATLLPWPSEWWDRHTCTPMPNNGRVGVFFMSYMGKVKEGCLLSCCGTLHLLPLRRGFLLPRAMLVANKTQSSSSLHQLFYMVTGMKFQVLVLIQAFYLLSHAPNASLGDRGRSFPPLSQGSSSQWDILSLRSILSQTPSLNKAAFKETKQDHSLGAYLTVVFCPVNFTL